MRGVCTFFLRRRKQRRKSLPEDKAESKELADWSKRSAVAEAKKLLVGVVFIFFYVSFGDYFFVDGLDGIFLGGKVQVGCLWSVSIKGRFWFCVLVLLVVCTVGLRGGVRGSQVVVFEIEI
ncbi:MAG: hypothetical protein BYD32DRAFT_260215 [Podila humilis]|nr:MAG: hypothetical protein BYD32DRAFT_260215 [Podila humilis]